MANLYLEEAARRARGTSGMNLYNTMVKSGASSLANSRDVAFQSARDTIGDNPALLREIISDLNARTGESAVNLQSQATQVGHSAEREEINRLTNLGTFFEQMKEQEKVRKQERIDNLIGGVISFGGNLAGGLIKNAGLNAYGKKLEKLIDKLNKKGDKDDKDEVEDALVEAFTAPLSAKGKELKNDPSLILDREETTMGMNSPLPNIPPSEKTGRPTLSNNSKISRPIPNTVSKGFQGVLDTMDIPLLDNYPAPAGDIPPPSLSEYAVDRSYLDPSRIPERPSIGQRPADKLNALKVPQIMSDSQRRLYEEWMREQRRREADIFNYRTRRPTHTSVGDY